MSWATRDLRLRADRARRAVKLPKFLQPEPMLFASLELLRVKLAEARELARVPCAWCPDFDGTIDTRGGSHGMCDTCATLFEQAIDDADREEHDDRDELPGSTCGAACGYCGRCS